MQEDLTEVRTGVSGIRYGTCSECGQVFILRPASCSLRWKEYDAGEEELSELCPQCEVLDLEDGEPLVALGARL